MSSLAILLPDACTGRLTCGIPDLSAAVAVSTRPPVGCLAGVRLSLWFWFSFEPVALSLLSSYCPGQSVSSPAPAPLVWRRLGCDADWLLGVSRLLLLPATAPGAT